MEKDLPNYYKILQVDPEAGKEVIKAAYRRLCALYHPDNNRGISSNCNRQMIEINRAFTVLGNTEKRSAYHREWLKHFTERDKQVHTIEEYNKIKGYVGMNSASEVMNYFFHALKTKNWDNAYMKLTEEDRERVSVEEFADWREAVSKCYDMQDYKVTFYKKYHNCRIDEVVYPEVAEFCVAVTDMDVKTLQSDTELLHKYAAFDGAEWKVCIGISSVKQAAMRYKLLAERKENYDPMMLFKGAVNRISPLTGLLSKTGLLDEGEREVYRSKRYGNKLSVVVFRILCPNKERETFCFCHFANIIRNEIRMSDVAGELEENLIACLFTETNGLGAMRACKKIMSQIEKSNVKEYTVISGIVEYQGFRNFEDMLFAAESKAAGKNKEILFN